MKCTEIYNVCLKRFELHWWCNGLHAHSVDHGFKPWTIVKPRTMKLAFAIFLKNTYICIIKK